MIGVDIVDLADPQLRERKNNHLRFIRHPKDLACQQETFWDFWAAKEAVFKAKRRKQQFNPKLIPIAFDRSNTTKTAFKSGSEWKGFVQRHHQYLIAVAYNDESNIYVNTHKIAGKNPRREIRILLQKWMFDTFGIKVDVKEDTDGLPYIQDGMSLSFSHHGNYMAFAIKM